MQLILNLSGDGLEHALLEAIETVARNFQTTVAERAQLLPSGRDRVIYSRVAWAKTHLQKAGFSLRDFDPEVYKTMIPLDIAAGT